MNEAPYISDTKHTKDTNKAENYNSINIRPLTKFNKLEGVYTHFKPIFGEDGTLIPNPSYRLMSANLGINYPPFLVYIKENGFDYYNPSIVIEPIESDELTELRLPENTPRETFKKDLFKIVKSNDPRIFKSEELNPKKGDSVNELWWSLIEDQSISTMPFLVKRGHRINDDDLRQVLEWDWEQFITDLLYMGANKDERLIEAVKTQLTPQFSAMRRCNSLNIWMTNPSTGKSTLAERVGEVVSRTTQRSITGGSSPNKTVVESFLMSYRKPVTVEHLEATDTEELLAHLITAISGIQSKVIVYQTTVPFNPFCSLIVSGNPNREKGQPNFEVFFNFIQGISKNYVALGRRVSIILYGDNFETIEQNESLDSNLWLNNLWTVWEEITTRILPLFREIFLCSLVQGWIYKEDQEYEARIKSVFSHEIMMIKEFFIDHARNVYPALKYRALSSAIVNHAQRLLSIALGEYEKDHIWEMVCKDILEDAKKAYKKLRVINYESIKNIAETKKLDIKILQDLFHNLPRYLRELLITLVHYYPEADKLQFPVDALKDTFDEIKRDTDPKLYSGFSLITQALNQYKPRRHFTRLSNFGISLRQYDHSDLWLISIIDLAKVEKTIDALSVLSVLSAKHTAGVSETLRKSWELELSGQDLKIELTPERYEDVKLTAIHWLKDPHNREYGEHWVNLDDFQRMISTQVDGRLDIAPEITRQLMAEGLIEQHNMIRGKIRLKEDSDDFT